MIKSAISYFPLKQGVGAVAVLAVLAAIVLLSMATMTRAEATTERNDDEKLVTVHDRGQEKVVLTKAGDVAGVLKEAGVSLDKSDAVEPKLDEDLIGKSYNVNIYRARPVVVTDGAIREKIMTPYQTADKIAAEAGIELHDEDKVSLKPTQDIIAEGAGVELNISRATAFTLSLYGKETAAYTQAKTVGAMLKDKNITLSSSDHLSVPTDAPMMSGMKIELWHDGKQTLNEEQEIPFTSEKVYDTNRPAGYREVQIPGVAGKRTVVYEVEMQSGREVGRKEIQNVVTLEPKKQIEVVGINPGNGLSRSKGANMFTDSSGVVHRETYYDLPMSAVMNACGGGDYSVRPDGLKVDKDGYILIAANLSRYPRCSVVQTSLGEAKVYDTGGFVARYPDGYDLATDWSNNNGR